MKMGMTIAFLLTSMAVPVMGEEEPKENPQVELDTSMGKIVLELFASKAPATVENFLKYVRSGHYDATIFHRVIPGFMIQGGGMTQEMQEKPTQPPISNEASNGLKNDRGTIAMARTMDPHSATGQFFINTVDNEFLNHTAKTRDGWGYAVFGRVTQGMDVVDAISGVKTGTQGMHSDVPREPVLIRQAKTVE